MRIPAYLLFGASVLAGASFAFGQGPILQHVSVPNRDTPVKLEITVKRDDGFGGSGGVRQAGGLHPVYPSKMVSTAHVSLNGSSALMGSDYYASDSCGACDCAECFGGCGGICGRARGHVQFARGLFCGPGNMYQHTPYMAAPKTYYYFRPYNYTHIPIQQGQAAAWGAPAGMPYSNEIFQNVYKQFEHTDVLVPPPGR